jgi:hypothetical protein
LTASLIIDFYYPDAPRHTTTLITASQPTTVTEYQCGVPSFSFVDASPTNLAGLLLPPPAPILAPAPPIPILAGPSFTAPPPPVLIDGAEPLPLPTFEVDIPPAFAPDSIVPIDVAPPNPIVAGPEPVEIAPPDAIPGPVLENSILEAIGFPAIPIVRRGKKKPLCTKLLVEAPSLTAGPTRTIWPETETVTDFIDCSDCTNLVHSTLNIGVPPVVIFKTTVTAETPSTKTVFACSKTPRQALPQPAESTAAAAEPSGMPSSVPEDPNVEIEELTKTVTPQGVLNPSCTTTTVLDPFFPDSTRTVYPSTVTATTTADCGSCELHWWTGVVYFFAPIIQTTTITVDYPSTKVDVACPAVTT